MRLPKLLVTGTCMKARFFAKLLFLLLPLRRYTERRRRLAKTGDAAGERRRQAQQNGKGRRLQGDAPPK